MLSLATTAALAAEHTSDSLDEVRQRVAKHQAVLVDVREPAEWKAGHLADAQLVPLSTLAKRSKDPAFTQDLAKHLGKEERRIVYCHCKAGGRALLAAEVFRKLGYDVRPLKAGYDDLVKAGFKRAADDDQGQSP
jgi:rhodanese-related sulfurtransferase